MGISGLLKCGSPRTKTKKYEENVFEQQTSKGFPVASVAWL